MKSSLDYSELGRSQCSVRKRNDAEVHKKRIIKKIILISSMNKDTMKIFLKMIECDVGRFAAEHRERLKNYSETILDKDKQKELDEELDRLYQAGSTQECNQCFLRLIKYFILSPVEKNYILKIESELREDERLEGQLQEVQQLIDREKQRKLELNRKVGGLERDPNEVGRRQTINQENKLEKAHQKLNEICASNNRLREKINQLRKEKNVMEEIYAKLKKELVEKKENVEQTIKSAGQAYCARNQAESQLRQLKETAEQQRATFKEECEKLNKEIQHDLRFKQFIKSKQKEKQSLTKLEEQIRQNEESIEFKKESNLKIDSEYRESLEKEAEIRRSFDRIKKEVGISDTSIEGSGKQLLNVFLGLYEKNTIMTNFVNQLNQEVEQLEAQIAAKKQEIQEACLKGTAPDHDHDRSREELKTRLEVQQRKKAVLKSQYDKSVETIGLIKQYLQVVFEEIEVDRQTTERLSKNGYNVENSSITEENLVEFLGEIEKRGLQAVSLYSKLVAEQIRSDNNEANDLDEHLNDLNNIITYENSSSMNVGLGGRPNQYPSELILKVREEDPVEESKKPGLMPLEEFRRFALDSLENFSKRTTNQLHRDKIACSKKFTMSTASKNKPRKRDN